MIFNDELDGFASECVDWASTGEPDTIYPGKNDPIPLYTVLEELN